MLPEAHRAVLSERTMKGAPAGVDRWETTKERAM